MNAEEHVRLVGILPSTKALRDVIDQLETAGFDRAQFGLLATDEVANWIPAGVPHTADAVAARSDAPTRAIEEPESSGAALGGLVAGFGYVGAIVAAGSLAVAGGPAIAIMAGATALGGMGAVAGALVARGFHHTHAEAISNQLAYGGMILWVQTRDAGQVRDARAAMDAAGATRITVQQDEY